MNSQKDSSNRKLIAEGLSGKVFLYCQEQSDGQFQNIIVKKFHLTQKHHYKSEFDAYTLVNPHPIFPKIVRFDEENLEIFMEYCSGGTLLSLLQKCGRFEEELAFIFFWQILKGLRHLKRKSFCHRDIKLENILLLSKEKGSPQYIKIIDLSFCAQITAAQTKEDRRSFQNQIIGTEGYQCPEMLEGKSYSGFEADIFSLGVLLFEMIHGKPPFFSASVEDCEFYELYNSNKQSYWSLFESLAPNKSSSLTDLIDLMLSHDPNKRISLGEIFKHPWVVLMQVKINGSRNESRKQGQNLVESMHFDFDKYKKLSATYNKSNFVSFLSRVFQNPKLKANKDLLMGLETNKEEDDIINQQTNEVVTVARQGLLGILEQRVLHFDGENVTQEDESQQTKKQFSNIFQLIRSYINQDTFMRLSYVSLHQKPVNLQVIKKKYAKKQEKLRHSYINRLITNNTIAGIAGISY